MRGLRLATERPTTLTHRKTCSNQRAHHVVTKGVGNDPARPERPSGTAVPSEFDESTNSARTFALTTERREIVFADQVLGSLIHESRRPTTAGATAHHGVESGRRRRVRRSLGRRSGAMRPRTVRRSVAGPTSADVTRMSWGSSPCNRATSRSDIWCQAAAGTSTCTTCPRA